jgi:hypothetical protein
MIFQNLDNLVLLFLAAAPILLLLGLWLFRRERERLLSRLLFALEELAEETHIPKELARLLSTDDLNRQLLKEDSKKLLSAEDLKRLLRTRHLKVRRDLIVIVSYEVLLIVGVALFYFSPQAKVWRIRRELIRSGVSQPIGIEWSHGDAFLTGRIETRGLSMEVSRKAMQIVGQGHVTNRLQIETPLILGSDSEELGAAEVSVDTAYDDSPRSLQEVQAILSLPQFETINANGGSTLQSLIEQRYGILRTKLPKSFEALSTAIAKLNSLSNTGKLHPGTLKMPLLPARYATQVSRKGHAAPKNMQGFVNLITSGLNGALQRVDISESLRPIGSSRVVLNIPFTRGVAKQTQEVSKVLPFSILRSRMRVQFESVGSASGTLHTTLSDEDRDAIMKGLKLHNSRGATVFILDQGWPDEDDYRNSLAELRRLVDHANQFYKLDAVNWDTPMTHDEFYSTVPPQHSVEIQQSLQEFTGMDREHVVKVVYVPMSRKQNSDQILREMLKLYMIRRDVGTRRDLSQVEKEAYSKKATDFEARVLNQLSPTDPGMPDAPGWGDPKFPYQQTWETDSSIAAAVWYLAELESYQSPTSSVYFLNESWTVLPDIVHFEAPDKSFGIVVAAVGNAPGMEVNGKLGEVEFARLATPANNVLAALDANAGDDQPECRSAMIAEADLYRTMAASFDGNVTEGVCGSSFSAPRIAWILALSEAVRTDSPDVRHWADSVQQKLIAARESGSWQQWKKVYLHPKRILP